MESFGLAHYRQAVHIMTEPALQTGKGIVLAGGVLDTLRHRRIIIPALDVIERVCAEAITSVNRHERVQRPDIMVSQSRSWPVSETIIADMHKSRAGASSS